MVFSSSVFIFKFLPVVLVIYFGIGKLTKNIKLQHVFLVLASLFFYGYFNIRYLWIILVSILVNYVCAILMQREKKDEKKKYLFIAGICFNVLLLGYFKYFDFCIETINDVIHTQFDTLNIMLPLGISFFTFQQLSFLISIKNNEEKIGNFIEYMLFVSFFPQLVAGPIVNYNDMMPQFLDYTRSRFSSENFAKGIYSFVIGLTKKMVIADTLASYVDNGYGLSEYGMAAAWCTALCYTLQIYFDFSGYSDMAIGLGNMFNIQLPVNFDSPYRSTSIKEFWGRWHITLGKSLFKFIYVPLGGNRKGKIRTCINLFVTFLVSGIWHGAAWTFIIWGCIHGIVRVLEKIFEKQLDRIPKVFKWFFTFMFVNAAWVLFRAPDFQKALNIYKGMINITNLNLSQVSTMVYDGIFTFPLSLNLLLLISILVILLMIVFQSKNSNYMLVNFQRRKIDMLYIGILFAFCLVHLSRLSTFIYFNF